MTTAAAVRQLYSEVQPVLAGVQQEAPAGTWPSLRIWASPTAIDITYLDGEGSQHATFHADGWPALADALVDFLGVWFDSLDDRRKTTIGEKLEARRDKVLVLLGASASRPPSCWRPTRGRNPTYSTSFPAGRCTDAPARPALP